MELALYIWFLILFVALVYYIYYDRKVRLGKPIYAAHSGMERLYHQLNDWDAQQAIAEAVASLMTSGEHLVRTLRLCKTRHAFPRQFLATRDGPADLSEDDLREALKRYHKQTKRPVEEAWRDINEQVETYLTTKGALRKTRAGDHHGTVVDERPGLRQTVLKVKEDYPFFNEYEPLHEKELKQIFEREGIEIYEMHDLPLLSLFAEYIDENGTLHSAVVIKKGIHRALQEFVLGHELGHWFLHIKSGFAKHLIGKNYYLHSSQEWTPLEVDADAFAMTALFPTPYLAEREIYEGPLSPGKVFEEFTRDMEGEISYELRQTMETYIETRLKRYVSFKNTILPLKIPITAVEEKYVEMFLDLLGGEEASLCWVRINDKSIIIEASDSFIGLFGATRHDIIGKLTPNQLIISEDIDLMKQRTQYRFEKKKAIFYFTHIRKIDHGSSSQVAVYSFPVIRNSEYVGSIAILVPIEQIEVTDFDSVGNVAIT